MSAELIKELTSYTRRKSGTQTVAKVPIDLLLRTIDAMEAGRRPKPADRELPAGHYLIRGVADFRGIPIGKLPECLADFLSYLTWAESARELLIERLGIEEVTIEPEFIWVDDGKTGIGRVDLQTMGGQFIGSLVTGETTEPGGAMYPYGSMGEAVEP